MTGHTYILTDFDEDGNESQYSADSRDYWNLPGSYSFGASLYRTDHPYRTTSGRIVHGWRLLKLNATVADLWRLGI